MLNNSHNTKSKMKLCLHIYLLVLAAGVFNLNEAKSIDSIHDHSIVKRQTVPPLTPTLTVDVGSQPPILPFPEVDEFYFPVNANLFNFTCMIKNPSYRYKMKITREQEFNNGSKNGPINLLNSDDMENLNPAVADPRFKVVFDDSIERTIKVSFLANNVQIKDSGTYKCSYSNLNKQIKITVYKPAHQNSVQLQNYKSFELNKATEVACTVKDVYPKPIITFYSPTKQKFDNDLIVVDDISDKSDSIYAYTLVNRLTYTPKYTDHNKNLTCSVFSYSNKNETIDTSFKVNILGNEFVSSECKEAYHANVAELDIEIVCVFFSNPPLNAEWTTKQMRQSSIVVNSATTIDGINSGSETSTIPPVTTMITQYEETVKIPSVDNDETNYIASLEEYGEPGSGLYKAVIRIKTVREEDFKSYSIRLFGNKNNTVSEYSIKLKPRSEYQDPNQLAMNPGSIVNFAERFHSNRIFILIIQSALFVILFNR